MKQLRNTIIRAGLETLYFSGAHRLLRPIFAGVGAIFMLHHVRPRRNNAFQPNHHLEITPSFLRATLAHVRSRGIDIVTADEMQRRLIEHDFARRFACFTFDDGYRDNRDFALPVMRDFDAPLTVYAASDFAEGTGRLWWVALERIVTAADRIDAEIGGTPFTSTPRASRRSKPHSPAITMHCADCRTIATSRARSAASARITASTKPPSAASCACHGTN